MNTAMDLRQIPVTLTENLPGLIFHQFTVTGVRFAVCAVDRPWWWPFGPPMKFVVCRLEASA